MEDDIKQIAAFNAELVCEAPNNRLAKFEGMMKWKDKTYSIDNEKMLLRGTMVQLIITCRNDLQKGDFALTMFHLHPFSIRKGGPRVNLHKSRHRVQKRILGIFFM